MAELDLGDGSWDDARQLVRQVLQRLEDSVHGNGREGVVTLLTNFITEYRTDERVRKEFQDKRDAEIKDARATAAEERNRRDTAYDRRLNRKLTIAALVLAAFTAWLGWRDYMRRTALEPPVPQGHQASLSFERN